jgi:hypothetical protein
MDLAEQAAKVVIEAAFPGARLQFRDDQSHGEHDFDLMYASGERGVVEATASVNRERTETEAALRKKGHFVARSASKKDWLIFLGLKPNINRVRAEVDRYLAAIEAAGLDRFHSATHADEWPSVHRIQTDLGVEAGGHVSWKNPAIGINSGAHGGVVSAQHGAEAAEREARKRDNRRKLAASGAAHRHLFVLLDMGNTRAWIAVRDLDPPDSPPPLPSEVTDIWAAASTGRGTGYVVWHGSEIGWERLEVGT